MNSSDLILGIKRLLGSLWGGKSFLRNRCLLGNEGVGRGGGKGVLKVGGACSVYGSVGPRFKVKPTADHLPPLPLSPAPSISMDVFILPLTPSHFHSCSRGLFSWQPHHPLPTPSDVMSCCLALVPTLLRFPCFPFCPTLPGRHKSLPTPGTVPAVSQSRPFPRVFSCLALALPSCLFPRPPGSRGGWQLRSCPPCFLYLRGAFRCLTAPVYILSVFPKPDRAWPVVSVLQIIVGQVNE